MALRGREAGGFFQKTTAPLSLMTTYKMSLISAGSISLDSTFKKAGNVLFVIFMGYDHEIFRSFGFGW
jgi:hypothetical protein